MRRRSRRTEPTIRFGSNEKQQMENKVDRLLARPLKAFPCPIPIEKLAAIWNAAQPQHLVQAVEVLTRDLHTRRNTDDYHARQVAMEFSDFILTASCRKPEEVGQYIAAVDCLFIVVSGSHAHVSPSLDFSRDLTLEENAAFHEWVNTCLYVNKAVAETRDTFSKVISICSTVGQLNRLVPECLIFVDVTKLALLAAQAKRSPMPSGYFDLDLGAVNRMNDMLTKCRLMPEVSYSLNAYTELTWAAEVKK